MSTSAVTKMPKAKIEIPVLAEEDVADFPAATASAEVVKEWLVTMCTDGMLKGGHLRLDNTKLTGHYLYSAKAPALMTVLRGMGFTDARLRTGKWIVGYIIAARRLVVCFHCILISADCLLTENRPRIVVLKLLKLPRSQ